MISKGRGDTYAWVERALIFALAVISLILLVGPSIRVALYIPLNYNEGWNAFNTARAFGPGPLYPDPAALISNNYPPLSFYIVGLLGYVISDNIIAGRVIALLSILIVALNIGVVTRRLNGSATIALFSAILFLASVITRGRAYTGIDDPQWLAHACVLVGFFVLLGPDHRSTRVIIAAVMMFIGGLVKHAVIPLPLAVTLWLFIYDRPRFLIWLAAGALLVAAAALSFYVAYGVNFFIDVFAAPRGYTLAGARGVKLWVGKFALLLPAPVILALSNPQPTVVLLLLYTLISALWGIFISFGQGVSINSMFDLYIALSISAGLAIEALARRASEQNWRAIRLIGMIVVVIPVLWALPENVMREVTNAQRLETVSGSRADIDYLAAIPGRAMCEDLSLCYWAGKEFEVDFFNTGQKISAGAISERSLVDLLEKQVFEVVQLEAWVDSPHYTKRLPGDLLRRALRNYVVDRRSGVSRVFLRPARTRNQPR